MSNSISLRSAASVDLSASSGKGKEEAQAPIDQLSDDVLDLIFRYATSNYRDKNALCKLREVSRGWSSVVDTYYLRSCWSQLQEQIQHPVLRNFITQIVSVDRFISQVLIAAIGSAHPELDASELEPLFNRVEFIGPSSYDRFSLLTQHLRAKGAPIPSTYAVIGFDPSPYEEMQQKLDTALESCWSSFQKRMSFARVPVLPHAKAIRDWLSGPINAKTIHWLTELNLSGINLTIFPHEMSAFSQLRELNLSKNRLTTLPFEINSFFRLRELNLSENQFTTFPAEISTLSWLTMLNLSKNRLTTLPSEIGKLSRLTTLDLGANQLSTLPLEIGNLSRLTSLSLSKNQFTTFPSMIGNFSQLESLSFSENMLTTLPPEIGKLSKVTLLFLFGNRLTNLPPEIGKLTQLKMLGLFENRLTTFPPEFANLSQLGQMILRHNPFLFTLKKEFQLFNEHKYTDFELITAKFSACSDYNCHTPLASLCQQIHLGKEGDLLRSTFETLSDEMQQRIRKAWAAIPSSSSAPSEAEADLFADRASFAHAVIIALQGKWASFPQAQRNQIYVQVAVLARMNKDIGLGMLFAEENIIRLIDAMELATQQ